MVEGDKRLSAVFIFYITGDARLGFLSARGAQPGRCTIHFGFTRRRNTLWWWYGCEQRRRCRRYVVPLSLPSIVRQRIHLTSQFFLVHSPSACRRAPSSIVVAWSRCPLPSHLPREQLPCSGRPPGGCLPSGRRSLLQRGGLGPCGHGGGASAKHHPNLMGTVGFGRNGPRHEVLVHAAPVGLHADSTPIDHHPVKDGYAVGVQVRGCFGNSRRHAHQQRRE